MTKLNDLGLIGFGNMGRNLAINILNNNYSLSMYNRTINKFNNFEHFNKNYNYFSNIKNFIISIKKPRKIIILITHGKPVDETLNLIINYLEKNDILIDFSNSFYKDSIRRNDWMNKFGIFFLDIGISGGVNGALNGLSLMSGGNINGFKEIKNLLKKISYKKNSKCIVNYLGKSGIGHYIKMIHNSIEYSKMQVLSDVYFILKNVFYIKNSEIGKIFNNWNNTNLKSYLLKITSEILVKKDSNNEYIIDKISDESNHNETVKWSVKNSIDIEEFSNISSYSLFMRYISSKKEYREKILNIFNSKDNKKIKYKNISNKYIKLLEKTIYISNLFSYIQAISQIEKMSKLVNWNINIVKILESLNNGTIIESYILNKIIKYSRSINKKIYYIEILNYFKNKIILYIKNLRKISIISMEFKIPTPIINSSLIYYDILCSNELSTKLIQAQRNYFGNHFYKRIDKEGLFSTKWK